MACRRRLSLRVVVSALLAALCVLMMLVLAACQPIQAPTESVDVAAQPGVEPTSALNDEPVDESVSAEDAAAPTITATVTVTTSVAVTATVTATATVSETATDNTAEGVTGSGADESGSSGDADSELVAAGLAVYRAQYCGVCHQLDAAGTRGPFGPTHNGMGTTAVERLADPAYQGNATTPREYIIESLVDPLAYIVPNYAMSSHRMPIYSHLTEEELDALAAFLLAQ